MQRRTGVGRITVTPAPSGGGDGTGGGGTDGGGGDGGTSAKPRVTIVVPARLAARRARRRGIVVLIGSTAAVPATVSAFRGKRRLARKAVRLKAPGPLRVRLSSRRFRAGKVRIVVRGAGFQATKRVRLR